MVLREGGATPAPERPQGSTAPPAYPFSLEAILEDLSEEMDDIIFLDAATDWPRGVYFGTGTLVGAEGVLRVGIVAASELPRDRSTLLVRFMAAGPLLAEAIAELAALEDGAHERAVAEQILVDLEHVLGNKRAATPEEEDLVMSILDTWKDARRIGATEARASDVLTVLRVRGIVLSSEDRERILAEKDPVRLERWLERAIVAASLAEVFDDESRAA